MFVLIKLYNVVCAVVKIHILFPLTNCLNTRKKKIKIKVLKSSGSILLGIV